MGATVADCIPAALAAAEAAIHDELKSSREIEPDRLARVAVEAAAPILAEESPKVRERARYWSEAVTPLRDIAEEIDETLEGFPANDPVILREMLAKARDTITRCVG